ncbi:unnamed protein product, partial [Didymodactylos carnosus]
SKSILEQMIKNLINISDDQVVLDYLAQQYFHPQNIELIKSGHRQDVVIKLRLYEYLISLCLLDFKIFDFIVNDKHQLLSQFFYDCLHSDSDVLFLMNCIELLTLLTEKLYTLDYLQNKTTIMDHFLRLLMENDDDLLKPAFIKLFGCYIRNYMQLISEQTTMDTTTPSSTNIQLFNRFIPFLFDILLLSDMQKTSLTFISLDTIGFIGKTFVGKRYMVNNMETKFFDCIQKLIQMIRSYQSDIRVRSMLCLADLFYLKENERNQFGWEVTEKIYTHCNHTYALLTLLTQIAKQPFIDLRLASHKVFLNMTYSKWAIDAMSNEPGFIEYLLNRQSEREKPGKESKYQIIKSLCSQENEELQAHIQNTVGNVTYLKFRRYANEGAFFVQPESNVAFDGAND